MNSRKVQKFGTLSKQQYLQREVGLFGALSPSFPCTIV